MPSTLPQTRIFLVGCPRSGTTLLQSLLAAHPKICSFPESHFFSTLIPNRKLLRQFDLCVRNIHPRLRQFFQSIGRDDLIDQFPKRALFNHQYAHQFIQSLDQIAAEKDQQIWIEKTPGHLHYIDYIEKLKVDAKFIHIVRNGTDVIASFYELAQRYPDVWGAGWSLERCVERWLNDVHISSSYCDQPNHILIRYERLVEQTQSILIDLAEFIGVEFDPQMLHNYDAVAQQVSLAHEPWKKPVGQTIQSTNSKKFYQVFDEEQRQYVWNQIAAIRLDHCLN